MATSDVMGPLQSRASTAVVTAMFFLLSVTAAAAESGRPGAIGSTHDTTSSHSTDHILVELVAPGRAADILGSSAEDLGRGWFRVTVPPHRTAEAWRREIALRGGVAVAELDPLFSPQLATPFTPNDPLFTDGTQWHLSAADAPEAWQTSVGSGVRVAILDTGVSNGPDGFCNGFVSEFNAVTMIAGPGAAADGNGHGSHVAGTVAQCSGNGIGGAGMAPDALIMPIVVLSPTGSASDIARGIDWAVEHGAKVVNLSLGCTDCSQSALLNDAIHRAAVADVLLVAASGNTATTIYYPASHPAVMAVGSTTVASTVWDKSARGLGLDLVAPGGDETAPVWQESNGRYVGYYGTSMAAAHVSGAAALLRSRFPGASSGQIRAALTCSTMDIGPAGWDGDSGYGILQAGDALAQLLEMVQSGTTSCGSVPPGSSKVGTVEIATGFWRLYQGSTQVASFFFGVPGDVGFFGDWNCDGVDTPGLYRRSDGFVYLRNSNTQGVADISYYFGIPGDKPLAGDFNGDGCDTVSIYRPSQARFYIINRLGSANGGLGAAEYSFLYGVGGDVPFVGDWNGDGIDTPGLRRSSNGFVYLRNTNTEGVADTGFFYGVDGDVVFSGDWDADGKDTIGLYRPSNGTIYLRNTNTTGVADFNFWVGTGKQPTAGDY